MIFFFSNEDKVERKTEQNRKLHDILRWGCGEKGKTKGEGKKHGGRQRKGKDRDESEKRADERIRSYENKN